MTDKVDLQVVGKEGDVSRAEMTQLLVDAFNQSGSAFENLLDAAYGETSPYSAQSDVDMATAEEGRQQLEELGLVCRIVEAGSNTVVGAIAAGTSAKPSITDVAEQTSITDTGAAAKSPATADTESVAEFDIGDLEFEDTSAEDDTDDAVASVRKMNSTLEKDADLEFTEELDSVKSEDGGENEQSVKQIESELDIEAGNPEFSDEFESDDDSGGASGISAAKSMEKPKADIAADVDFSESIDDSVAPMLSKKAARKSRGDVPDALEGASFDDLEADLIDPAPAEKAEKKEPVELDDGGLSLSDGDSAPLTQPKSKSDSVGLSLSDDDSAPLTQPKSKSDSVADDGGLSLDDNSLTDNNPSNNDAPAQPPVELETETQTSADTTAPATDKTDLQLPEIDSGDESPAVAKPDTVVTPDLTTAPATTETPEQVGPAAAVGVVAGDESASNDPSNEQTASAAPVTDTTSTDKPADAENNASAAAESAAPASEEPKAAEAPAGLVLSGQINPSIVPNITREEDLEDVSNSAPSIDDIDRQASISSSADIKADTKTADEESAISAADIADTKKSDKANPAAPKKRNKAKKVVAAVAGVAVLAGAGTFAFKNAGSLSTPVSDRGDIAIADINSVTDSSDEVNQVQVETGNISNKDNLEQLSTGELLVNLSVSSNASSIVELEPYFLESVNRARSGPRFGAAVPADSNSMTGRAPHPADAYFDDWSNREADLSLFLALLDTLIKKGELDVAQQLSDRAKDKLFAVLSAQRLARAYSESGDNDAVARLMSNASRDTFSIKDAEERVLAISDYGLTEQALGLNEDAMDTFLTTSILARSLTKPERKTVGLSSAARYFHRSGRERDAQQLLTEALDAGMQLPDNTAARDLAIRFVALTEARMGLFNQAIDHTKLITDPVAAVSAYHGVALAVESTGDHTNARKILNMAYRTGSKITDKEERTKLLDKVVLASESD